MYKTPVRPAEELRSKTELPNRNVHNRDTHLTQSNNRSSSGINYPQTYGLSDRSTQRRGSNILGHDVPSSGVNLRQSRQVVDEGKLNPNKNYVRSEQQNWVDEDLKNKQLSSHSKNSIRQGFSSEYVQSPVMIDKNKHQPRDQLNQGLGIQQADIKKLKDDMEQLKIDMATMKNVICAQQQQKFNVISKEQQQIKIQLVKNYSIIDRFNSQVGFIYNHLNQSIPEYAKHHQSSRLSSQPESSQQVAIYQQKLEEQIKERQKIQETCLHLQKSLEKIKRESQNSRSYMSDSPKVKNQSVQPIFLSAILRHHGQSFLRESIENFMGKAIKGSSMLYQMDKFNKNIGNYIEQGPFPYLLLLHTSQNSVFGIFGEGIEVRSTLLLRNQQRNNKFKAFLFNLDKKQLFKNERPSSLNSAVYSDGSLRLGNNEVLIKNNYLSSIKVFAGNIFGESYFSIRYRELLVGFDAEEVPLKALQLHQVEFEGPQS